MRLTIKHCVAAMPEIFLVKVSAITREDVVALADVAYRMSGRRVTDASAGIALRRLLPSGFASIPNTSSGKSSPRTTAFRW
jgi:hypothetical protein